MTESSPRGFPYEDRLTAEAQRLLGRTGRLDLGAAAKDLIALQRGLTGERGLIGSSYMDERRALAAYLLFYWPVSYAQVRAMLRMAGFGPSRASLRVLDLGSGPAPCSIAAADALAGNGVSLKDAAPGPASVSIVACDQSPLALESAARLAAASGRSLEAVPRWNAAGGRIPDGTFDLIVMGHVLNELWADAADRLDRRFAFLESALSRLAPGGALLFLEPALLKTAREAIALRDRLAASGRRILAPCLRAGPCPALDSENQTCHSDFAWDVPPLVRALSERTGLGKDLVKTAAFVVAAPAAGSSGAAPSAGAKPGAPGSVSAAEGSEAREYRVVSDAMINKAGRVRYLLCGEDGRFPLSAKKGEGFSAEKAFFSLRRSDRISLVSPVRRETGLALGSETAILIEKR